MKDNRYGWAAYGTLNEKEILMDEEYGILTINNAIEIAKKWCEDVGVDYDDTISLYVSKNGGPYNLCDDNGDEIFDS